MSPLLTAKHIVEFRFPAKAVFHDVHGSICANFQVEPFTEWRINPNRIELHSKDKRYSAFSTSKNAGINIEFAEGDDEFLRHLRRYARLINDRLNLTHLTRVGMRTHILVPQENFDVASSIFSETIYSEINNQLQQLGDVYDYGCIWDLEIDQRKAHFRCGPMEPEQLRRDFLESKADEEMIPEAFIFVDFDIYVDNPEFGIRTDRFITQFATSALTDIFDRTRRFLQGFGIDIIGE